MGDCGRPDMLWRGGSTGGQQNRNAQQGHRREHSWREDGWPGGACARPRRCTISLVGWPAQESFWCRRLTAASSSSSRAGSGTGGVSASPSAVACHRGGLLPGTARYGAGTWPRCSRRWCRSPPAPDPDFPASCTAPEAINVADAHVVGTTTTLQVGLARGRRPPDRPEWWGVYVPDDLAVIKVTTVQASFTRRRSTGREHLGASERDRAGHGKPHFGLTGTVDRRHRLNDEPHHLRGPGQLGGP